MTTRRSFFHGAVIAAVLALAAAISVTGLTVLAGGENVIRLVVPLICGAYLLLLLRGERATTGRAVTLVAWTVFSIAAWWAVESLAFYLLLHAGAIWLTRSLFVYASLLPAVADLLLTTLSAAAFSWALARSGSVMLATWCFFLVQALWTQIPPRLPGRGVLSLHHTPDPTANDRFDKARRRADAAIRQLSTGEPR